MEPNPRPDHPPAPADAARLALLLARSADAGHFDELAGLPGRGGEGPPTAMAPHWARFFAELGPEGFGDLNRRTASLQRQIRDNGVTYNVYADSSGPQRPWSLDLFPLIVTPACWQQIESGVLQRVQLLEHLMADVYGPQTLLRAGLLPAALVQGHPGYLRSLHGVAPVGGTHLHIAAFDLARGSDGHWWVVSQRTQAPSGLGYLLENRLSISRLFPQGFEALHVQRLAGAYRALVEHIKQQSPAGADAHIALLTPGPYNETYFEHAYLARYLGLTLVQGSDLTVRDERLYLRTLQGLEPIHGLLRRVDDAWLDPLELRPDSSLGVPGLLQAIRAGHLVMANAPGAGFLESSALLGFLPALSQAVLGKPLQLPALPTWWCGERAALESALPRLGDCVIKPTYPPGSGHAAFDAVPGGQLGPRQLDEWAGRIRRAGEDHTLQAALPLSQMPTWRADPHRPGIAPRAVMLRVFALADGPGHWRVLPGGLARLVSATAGLASMQRGGSSADVWVLVDRDSGATVDRSTLLQPHLSPASLAQRKRLVTSRAAENLFWLGRYTERAENCLRLARLTLEALHGEDQHSSALLAWLTAMARSSLLVGAGVPPATQSRRVFERALIAGLCETSTTASVGFNLRAVRNAASAVRERLSQEQWNLVVRAEQEFFARSAEYLGDGEYSTMEALRVLESTSGHLAAMTGAQTDRMTRDDGWRLLSVGRQIERLGFLASALSSALHSGALADSGGFESVVALFDSTITFHAHYQQSRELAALLDLLVLNRDNPRSLGWVAQTLRGRLSRLAGSAPGEVDVLARGVPDPRAWRLEALCDLQGARPALGVLLDECSQSAWRLSDEISLRYFTHTGEPGQSLGA